MGNYYIANDNGAASLLNKPASLKNGFGMKVFKSCGIDTWLIQEIIEAYYGTMWRRCVVIHNDGTFNYAYDWVKYMSTGGDTSVDDQSKIPYWTLDYQGIPVTSGQDFNNMVTYGNYYCPAGATSQTLLHKPSSLTKAFCMKVYCSSGPDWWNWLIQEIVEYDGQNMWRRFIELYDSGTNKGTLKNAGTWYKLSGTAD